MNRIVAHEYAVIQLRGDICEQRSSEICAASSHPQSIRRFTDGVLDAIYESRVQVSDSLAWVKGNHVAKFGADFNYVNNFVIDPGFTPMRAGCGGVIELHIWNEQFPCFSAGGATLSWGRQISRRVVRTSGLTETPQSFAVRTTNSSSSS